MFLFLHNRQFRLQFRLASFQGRDCLPQAVNFGLQIGVTQIQSGHLTFESIHSMLQGSRIGSQLGIRQFESGYNVIGALRALQEQKLVNVCALGVSDAPQIAKHHK